MSKIRAELIAAASTVKGFAAQARGEAEAPFMIRLQKAIAENISDEVWKGLSDEAQSWNNDSADLIQAGKGAKEFPADVAAPPATRTRSRTAAAEPAPAPAPAEYVPTEGDEVVVTTKRGKEVQGFLVKVGADFIVLNKDGSNGAEADDQDFDLDAITIKPLAAAVDEAPAEDAGDEQPNGPEVGDTIELVNARDKKYLGNVLEISDTLIVIKDIAGEEHEFAPDRVKSIVIKVRAAGATPAPAPAPPARRGRTAAAPAAAPAAEEGKRSRSVNPGLPSVGQRIREIVCANPAGTVADVDAALKKEGYEFRDQTLDMIFKDTQTVIGLLKASRK